MTIGIQIFYRLIMQDNEKIRYAYSGGCFSDSEELVKAYDGIVVINRTALSKEIEAIKYGIDFYQEKGCSACEKSNNVQIKNVDGTTVDLFALKVVSKVCRRYKEIRSVEEENSIVY